MKVLSDVGREGVTRILTAKQRTKERVTTAERNLSTASKLPTRNIKERPRDNPQRKRGRRQEKANEVKSVNCLSLLVWYSREQFLQVLLRPHIPRRRVCCLVDLYC
jgi:hypothetical protein